MSDTTARARELWNKWKQGKMVAGHWTEEQIVEFCASVLAQINHNPS